MRKNDCKQLSPKEIKTVELNILLEFQKFCDNNNLTFYLCGGTLLGSIRHKGFIPWDDDIDVCMIRSDYEKLIQICNSCTKKLPNNLKLICFENSTLYAPYIKILDTTTFIKEEKVKNNKSNSLWIDILPVDGLPSDTNKVKKIYKKTYFWRKIWLLSIVRLGYGKNIFKIIIKPIFILFSKIIGQKKCTRKLIKIAKKNDVATSEYVGIVSWGLYGPGERMRKKEFLESVEVEFEGHMFKTMSCWDSYLKNLYGDYMKLPPKEKRINHQMKVYSKIN